MTKSTLERAARLERAWLSLEGLSIGDAFGEQFFLRYTHIAEALIAQRAEPPGPWAWTDDTEMALAIVEVLDGFEEIDRDALARAFVRRYVNDPHRGYGSGAHDILGAIAAGEPWQEAAAAVFGGTGSMGNGGAMRAAPLGGYFAEDLDAVVAQARASAQVTHAHPEGQAGAIAVAVAAAWAWRHRGDPALARELIQAAVERTPDGDTRAGLVAAAALPFKASVAEAVGKLGNGSRIISRDTAPFALWCAARHIDDFTEAMWATVSGLGDRDTTCAIVGGIVALHVGAQGIDPHWRASRAPLLQDWLSGERGDGL